MLVCLKGSLIGFRPFGCWEHTHRKLYLVSQLVVSKQPKSSCQEGLTVLGRDEKAPYSMIVWSHCSSCCFPPDQVSVASTAFVGDLVHSSHAWAEELVPNLAAERCCRNKNVAHSEILRPRTGQVTNRFPRFELKSEPSIIFHGRRSGNTSKWFHPNVLFLIQLFYDVLNLCFSDAFGNPC